MIKLLVSLAALLVTFALTYGWYLAGIGMNETVTKIGYIVIMLVSVCAIGTIEEAFGVDKDEQ